MLAELFRTGIWFTQVIGLIALLWGSLTVFFALIGARGMGDAVRGGVLMAFGVALASLGRGF